MLVYRLERDGVGPFRQSAKMFNSEHRRLNLMVNDAMSRHDSISALMQYYYPDNAPMVFFTDFVCGFISIEEMIKVFMEDMIEEAMKLDFTVNVYDVNTDASSAYLCEKQVFFDTTKYSSVKTYTSFKEFKKLVL